MPNDVQSMSAYCVLTWLISYIFFSNLSEGLLSAGFAEVVRHRKDEDRSIHYEEYVSAENRYVYII